MSEIKKKNWQRWKDTGFACEMFVVMGIDESKTILDEPTVKVVERFRASTLGEAIEHARKYREEHKTDGCTYYWRYDHSEGLGEFGLWHCDGICSWGASDVDCVFIDWIAKVRVKLRNDKDYTNHKHWTRKIARIRKLSSCKVIRGLLWCWLKFWGNLVWYAWDKPCMKFRDWHWNRRNFNNWRKTGHSLSEHWSLEMHLLRDLKYNLKLLNEDGYALNTEFMYDVLRERHPDESPDEIECRMSRIMASDNRDEAEKIENLAAKRQKETYERICHLVDLYTFYLSQEIDDKEPTRETLTDDMHFHLVDCTYNMLDHGKMYKESKKIWNEIWFLVGKYGQQMCD